jgi:hypothetical protein
MITDVVRHVRPDRVNFSRMTDGACRVARQSLSGRSEHRQQGDDAWIHFCFWGVTVPFALPYP